MPFLPPGELPAIFGQRLAADHTFCASREEIASRDTSHRPWRRIDGNASAPCIVCADARHPYNRLWRLSTDTYTRAHKVTLSGGVRRVNTIVVRSCAAILTSFSAFAIAAGAAELSGDVSDPGSSTGRRAPAGDQGLEEIIVTADKRSESINKVPLAITALSGSALQDQNIHSVEV